MNDLTRSLKQQDSSSSGHDDNSNYSDHEGDDDDANVDGANDDDANDDGTKDDGTKDNGAKDDDNEDDDNEDNDDRAANDADDTNACVTAATNATFVYTHYAGVASKHVHGSEADDSSDDTSTSSDANIKRKQPNSTQQTAARTDVCTDNVKRSHLT